MSLLVLLGAIAIFVGLLWVLHWLKSMCPACRKPWRETGQVRSGGFMAGRTAYMKEWQCPACGHSDWIKSF
jgi:hypothetical protein